MWTWLRRIVSQRKLRFETDEFSLDLAYILPRVIAMGYPAGFDFGFEWFYRNKRSEVKRLLETRYPGKHMVVNLCLESSRNYESWNFELVDREHRWADHCSPPLFVLWDLLQKIDRFLSESDSDSVVAIHCKAGLGRTGLAIVSLLLFSNLFQSVHDANKFYGEKRTENGRGVAVPSQVRYCEYIHELLKMVNCENHRPTYEVPFPIARSPVSLSLLCIEVYGKNGVLPSSFIVSTPEWSGGKNGNETVSPISNSNSIVKNTRNRIVFELENTSISSRSVFVVKDDVKMTFFREGLFGRGNKRFFDVQFHTFFVPKVTAKCSYLGADASALDGDGDVEIPSFIKKRMGNQFHTVHEHEQEKENTLYLLSLTDSDLDKPNWGRAGKPSHSSHSHSCNSVSIENGAGSGTCDYVVNIWFGDGDADANEEDEDICSEEMVRKKTDTDVHQHIEAVADAIVADAGHPPQTRKAF